MEILFAHRVKATCWRWTLELGLTDSNGIRVPLKQRELKKDSIWFLQRGYGWLL
jgi:hypothetical protein